MMGTKKLKGKRVYITSDEYWAIRAGWDQVNSALETCRNEDLEKHLEKVREREREITFSNK